MISRSRAIVLSHRPPWGKKQLIVRTHRAIFLERRATRRSGSGHTLPLLFLAAEPAPGDLRLWEGEGLSGDVDSCQTKTEKQRARHVENGREMVLLAKPLKPVHCHSVVVKGGDWTTRESSRAKKNQKTIATGGTEKTPSRRRFYLVTDKRFNVPQKWSTWQQLKHGGTAPKTPFMPSKINPTPT